MRDLSELPDGWRSVRLGDVVTMSQGGTPRKKRPEYWGGHIPFVTGADLREVRVSREHARSFLSEAGLRSGDTVICEPAALLLATRTRVGLAGMATEVMGASQDITRLEPNGDVDPSYLCRVLVRNAPTLQRRARGTTIQGISRGDVASLQILVPPLSEQRGIAAILDAIDEAIERTEAVISATERLRDALLHELLTRGVPGWHTEWRDVPGLGTVPADWQVVRLGDAGHWLSGGTPSKVRSDYWSGTLPWVSPKDMKARELCRTGDHISQEGAKAGSRVVPEGTIFVVVRGMILAHSFPLAVSRVAAAFNQDIRALVCRDGLHPDFVLAALEHQKPRLLQLPTPSTHGTMRVESEELFAVQIPTPSSGEQRAIAAVLGGVDDTIAMTHQNRVGLQSLKTSAADALLTGRVQTPHLPRV